MTSPFGSLYIDFSVLSHRDLFNQHFRRCSGDKCSATHEFFRFRRSRNATSTPEVARENLSVYRRCSGDKCKIPLLFAGGILSEMKVYPGEQPANFPVPRSGIQSPIRGLKEEICIFDRRRSGNNCKYKSEIRPRISRFRRSRNSIPNPGIERGNLHI